MQAEFGEGERSIGRIPRLAKKRHNVPCCRSVAVDRIVIANVEQDDFTVDYA
jgi:hypothetical protein